MLKQVYSFSPTCKLPFHHRLTASTTLWILPFTFLNVLLQTSRWFVLNDEDISYSFWWIQGCSHSAKDCDRKSLATQRIIIHPAKSPVHSAKGQHWSMIFKVWKEKICRTKRWIKDRVTCEAWYCWWKPAEINKWVSWSNLDLQYANSVNGKMQTVLEDAIWYCKINQSPETGKFCLHLMNAFALLTFVEMNDSYLFPLTSFHLEYISHI